MADDKANSTQNPSSFAPQSNYAMVKEGWGSRSNFQHSYGLKMEPDDFEEGNAILEKMREYDEMEHTKESSQIDETQSEHALEDDGHRGYHQSAYDPLEHEDVVYEEDVYEAVAPQDIDEQVDQVQEEYYEGDYDQGEYYQDDDDYYDDGYDDGFDDGYHGGYDDDY